MEKQTPSEVNHLLNALPAEIYTQLQSSLEEVPLSLKDALYEQNTAILHVYFPLTGVCSLLTVMQDGTEIEIATVGNEGMIGLPVFLGGDTIPGKGIVQVPGKALRMSSTAFQEAVRQFNPLRDLLERYTQALFVFVSQSAACNRVHDISQRCARWLLLTQDRVGNETFPLTQEFLSQMLVVRRATISEIANNFQREGIIEYHRGEITIVNRQGLEEHTCECYWIVRKEFERIIGAN